MKILGAIIAGGRATRFDGDKGAALLDGKALIDHVVDGLSAHCTALMICGREWPGLASITDRPAPDMGPLGGLNAALYVAQQNGFDAVLSAGCDVLPVPTFGADQAGPCVVAGHYLFGLWPSSLSTKLDQHLTTQNDYSMRRWIGVSGATEIACDTPFHNLNTRADVDHYARARGNRA